MAASVRFCAADGDVNVLITSHTCSKTLAAYRCLYRMRMSCVWYLSFFLISSTPLLTVFQHYLPLFQTFQLQTRLFNAPQYPWCLLVPSITFHFLLKCLTLPVNWSGRAYHSKSEWHHPLSPPLTAEVTTILPGSCHAPVHTSTLFLTLSK